MKRNQKKRKENKWNTIRISSKIRKKDKCSECECKKKQFCSRWWSRRTERREKKSYIPISKKILTIKLNLTLDILCECDRALLAWQYIVYNINLVLKIDGWVFSLITNYFFSSLFFPFCCYFIRPFLCYLI